MNVNYILQNIFAHNCEKLRTPNTIHILDCHPLDAHSDPLLLSISHFYLPELFYFASKIIAGKYLSPLTLNLPLEISVVKSLVFSPILKCCGSNFRFFYSF